MLSNDSSNFGIKKVRGYWIAIVCDNAPYFLRSISSEKHLYCATCVNDDHLAKVHEVGQGNSRLNLAKRQIVVSSSVQSTPTGSDELQHSSQVS
jgi:hypothetical protein